MRTNYVVTGLLLLISGLALVALASGSHGVKIQDISVQKEDGFYAFTNSLMAGQDFTAEFICHQPQGELRMVLVTESWYYKWREGQNVPSSELLGDSYGRQGRIAVKVERDDVYELVLVPNTSTASWSFDVSVRLESTSGRGGGWFLGVLLFLCGIVLMGIGFVRKARVRTRTRD